MKPIFQPFDLPAPPFELFRRLAHLPQPLFLDSADAPAKLGRFSFLAADPFLRIHSKNGRVTVNERAQTADPFEVLRHHWRQYPLETAPIPPPFQGGVAGFWSYDLAHHLERLPRPPLDELGMADMDVGFYDCVLAIDHTGGRNRGWLIASGYPEASSAARRRRAEARIAQFRALLNAPARIPLAATLPPIAPPQSSFRRPDYLRAIERVKAYIARGDIYQANIAQRFQTPFRGDPLALYALLRRINPASFAACLLFGDTAIASVSPERFLLCRGGKVETRPIKGTRPRGRTPAEDVALSRELHASPKDRAENVMIVDLLRNDLSRVCRLHSVRVPELFAVEAYPTVWHLVSTVVGELKPDCDPIDLLRATFPGGSITGAPKIRAMEIIAEIEGRQRGLYCGSIGYLGFDGTLDTSIVIRTAILRGGMLTFHGGGGIVADSDPAAEYDETLVKVKSFFDALARPPQTSVVRRRASIANRQSQIANRKS